MLLKHGDVVLHKENRMLYRVVGRAAGWLNPVYVLEPTHKALRGCIIRAKESEIALPPAELCQ